MTNYWALENFIIEGLKLNIYNTTDRKIKIICAPEEESIIKSIF